MSASTTPGGEATITLDQGAVAMEKMKAHSLTPIDTDYLTHIPVEGFVGIIGFALAVGFAWVAARRLAQRLKSVRFGRG